MIMIIITKIKIIKIIIMYTLLCHFSIQDRAHGPLQAYAYIDIYIYKHTINPDTGR